MIQTVTIQTTLEATVLVFGAVIISYTPVSTSILLTTTVLSSFTAFYIYIFIHHIMVAQQKKIYSKKLNNLTKVE